MRTFLLTFLLASAALAQTPPPQPTSGPGGSEYTHAAVISTTVGSGATACVVYEPRVPMPLFAPVVFFCHGWDAVNPDVYKGWIEHQVKKGRVVIFPVYQERGSTLPAVCLGNAITGIKAGLDLLWTSGHVHPRLDRVGAVGHSFGGVMAANLAAVASKNGLPQPKAVMCAHPGAAPWIYEDLSKIPAGTLLVTCWGEDDSIATEAMALRIKDEATSIPAADKDHIRLRSDRHGSPALITEHGALTSMFGATTNALDFYGYWKWWDALTDAAWFDGKNRAYALGNTAEQRFMGKWSDEVAVVEPLVTD